MTTCAWDGLSVAADTQGNSAGMAVRRDKIYRGSGHVLLGSGAYHHIVSYWRRIKDMPLADVLTLGYPDYDEDKNYPALLLVDSENPHLAWHIDGTVWARAHGFYAIGSGRDFAMAAMALGKSAKEAVELAARFDVNTGGDIDWVVLK